jgi:hypothetical protein
MSKKGLVIPAQWPILPDRKCPSPRGKRSKVLSVASVRRKKLQWYAGIGVDKRKKLL